MKQLLLCLLTLSATSHAVTVPNDFQPNTPARAAEVNANFQSLVDAVNAMQIEIDVLSATNSTLVNQVETLEFQISAQQTDITNLHADVSDLESARIILQNQVATLENNTVLSLNGYLSLDTIDGNATAVFEEINLQVISGGGITAASVNGLGNLIVGYNSSFAGLEFCTNPIYDSQPDCENNSGTWDVNVHTGSHNIIIGEGHSYTGYGAMVSGYTNVSNGNYASVLGGFNNIASGSHSTISGGFSNNVSGDAASISGGAENTASESYSSVSGGQNNTASGGWSSITGGTLNVSQGTRSSVSGGYGNQATANESSVSGGRLNTASAWHTTVGGGSNREADTANEWVAGSLSEDN